MVENEKNMLTALFIATLGTVLVLADYYNGMDDILPRIFNVINKEPEVDGYSTDYKYTMNYAYFFAL